ncbi:hypothetical protein NDU88_006360 [Pleurodeles waltl]|uniref:Uncharacterized protein n=1 Tax=Pleurodeles waltl TaxID=8319 RepID=A0AAV7PL79_PLEWA|nr:hypothetical protein NDU88_006360 [Pleurodeles waltl]
MGRDKSGKGAQQTQHTAQNVGGSLQKELPGSLEQGSVPAGAQILAAIEAYGQVVQKQIAAMAGRRELAVSGFESGG